MHGKLVPITHLVGKRDTCLLIAMPFRNSRESVRNVSGRLGCIGEAEGAVGVRRSELSSSVSGAQWPIHRGCRLFTPQRVLLKSHKLGA